MRSFWPRSTLGRTVLLLAILLLGAQGAVYVLFHQYVLNPAAARFAEFLWQTDHALIIAGANHTPTGTLQWRPSRDLPGAPASNYFLRQSAHYLAKPFHPRELVARIQAILRRTHAAAPRLGAVTAPFQCGPFTVDMGRQEIQLGGQTLSLTSAEFQTLATLIQHEGQPLTREKLMWLTRGRQLESDDRSIDMQISRLRRLLDSIPGRPRHIRTVWGHGYLFVAEP